MWNIEKVEKIFQNTSFDENNRSKTLNMLELIELPYKAIFELIQNFILQLYLILFLELWKVGESFIR